VYKATKDKQLSLTVSKMLSHNIFEMPELQTVANLIENKAKDINPVKRRAHTNNIEIDIEHIKLESSRAHDEVDFKKKLRPCCAEKESSLEKINQEIKTIRELREQKDHKDKEQKQVQERRAQWNYWSK
jgi:phosphatidate phosphatase PAH1